MMEIQQSKRQRVNGFSYLNIPSVDQDTGHIVNENDPFSFKLVPCTSHGEVLRADVFRAESVTRVDSQNDNFVKSCHPALAFRERVWVSESSFGEPVWVVESPTETVHAGGRPIHYFPHDYLDYVLREILTPRSPDKFNMHFDRFINPRRSLTATDLDSLRELFPKSTGVEVLVAGFLVVLFEDITDVQDALSYLAVGTDRAADNSLAITTATHGFVHCPTTSGRSNLLHQMKSMFDKVKKSLAQYLPLGKITRTYDQPSNTAPYLAGYTHDLSLITDDALPDVSNPPGYPLVTGWADYSAALDGQDVYVVCHQTNVGRWRVIEGNMDSTLFKRAVVLGTGYNWNRDKMAQSAFVLWHMDATAKAIVFQSFQRMCVLDGQPSAEAKLAIIKAGFVLPPDIKNSTIMKQNLLRIGLIYCSFSLS
ncbi:hypothetical protein BDW62DRAFT_218808 [Aspergillus aurantiobrunneus]